jgi:hypothetical protein
MRPDASRLWMNRLEERTRPGGDGVALLNLPTACGSHALLKGWVAMKRIKRGDPIFDRVGQETVDTGPDKLLV